MSDVPQYKAIETQYKGYRFRSRLEARWAVFFETLGIRWYYEKEGFNLGDAGHYLPDFGLPFGRLPTDHPYFEGAKYGEPWDSTECGYWLEIKGTQPTERERNKALALATLGHSVCLFQGDPKDCAFDRAFSHFPKPAFFLKRQQIEESYGSFNFWSKFDFKNGRGMMYRFPHLEERGGLLELEFAGLYYRAVDAARSARFEFGETPA